MLLKTNPYSPFQWAGCPVAAAAPAKQPRRSVCPRPRSLETPSGPRSTATQAPALALKDMPRVRSRRTLSRLTHRRIHEVTLSLFLAVELCKGIRNDEWFPKHMMCLAIAMQKGH